MTWQPGDSFKRQRCEACGKARDDVEYYKSADAYFCDECFTDFQDELEAERGGRDI